jgi:hypothetical protein
VHCAITSSSSAAAAAGGGGCVQNGGLQNIADDISKSVKTNCGKKAIVLSHSYGANVMAALFQKPGFEEWRWVTHCLKH